MADLLDNSLDRPLSDKWEREERGHRTKVRLEIANLQQRDAGKSRRILSVAAHTALPYEVIEANLEHFERQVSTQQFDRENFIEESPVWAEFASRNPLHLSVLKEDMDALPWLERTWKQMGLAKDAGYSDVAKNRILARRRDGNKQPGDEEQLASLSALSQPHDFGAQGFAEVLVKSSKLFPMTQKAMENAAAYGGATALGFMGMTAAVSGAVPGPDEIATVPAAGLLGLSIGGTYGLTAFTYEQEGGAAYGQYLDMGLSEESAAWMSRGVGLLNAGLETAGLGVLARSFGVPSVTGDLLVEKFTKEIFVKPTMARAAGMLLMRTGETLGAEVVTEVLQESVTWSGQQMLLDREGRDAWDVDEYLNVVMETAEEIMKGAAIMSSIGPGARFLGDSMAARKAKQMEFVYREAGNTAKSSKTQKTAPRLWTDFVNSLAKDGKIDSFLVDRKRFTEYFQSINEDPEQAAKELGAKLDPGDLISDYVEIPASQYATKIFPSEHHEALVMDVKSNSDAMTAREAGVFDKIRKDLVKEMLGDVEAPDDGIEESVTGSLVDFHGLEDAEKMAKVMGAAFRTLAATHDMDAEALFERYFGGVTTELPAALQGKDIDINVDPMLDQLRKGDVPTQMQMRGDSMVEFIKSVGGLKMDPELDARDVGLDDKGKRQEKRVIRDDGRSLDAMAEVAAEAGYIATHDQNLFLEALDRELGGSPVFAPGNENVAKMDQAGKLEELQEFIDAAGIDLQEVDNSTARKLLKEGQTFNQPATSQDFGNVTFTDTVQIQETGEIVEVSESGQVVFDRAVERKKVLETLMNCVSA